MMKKKFICRKYYILLHFTYRFLYFIFMSNLTMGWGNNIMTIFSMCTSVGVLFCLWDMYLKK